MLEPLLIKVSGEHDNHKTTRIDIDRGRGIRADYCKACDTLAAYVFDAERWDEADAQKWAVTQVSAPELSGLAVIVERFERVLEHIGEKLGPLVAADDGEYSVQGFHSEFGKADEKAAWSFAPGDGNALVEKGGWLLFKRCHLVCDASEGATPENKGAYTYPVAKLVGGKPTYFYRAAVTIYAGLRGGAREAKLPQSVKESCLSTVKRIYRAFDKDSSEMKLADTLEGALVAGLFPVFETSLAQEQKIGVVVNEKGWIKKTILTTGEWVEPAPGHSEPLKVTLTHLSLVARAFEEGAFERVSVPLGHGNDAHVAQFNTGFVRALEIDALPSGEYTLDAWIEFI